jgi:hypothetical protein
VTAAGPRPPWLDDPDGDADPVLAGVVAAALVGAGALDELVLLLQPAAASAATTRAETPKTAGLRPFLLRDTLDLPPR